MKTAKIKWMFLLLACVLVITNVPIMAKDFVVCVDPGHQAKGDPKGEPIAPGSGNKKARVASGTAGVGTKKPEYAVNMEAGLILKNLLTQKGYKVVMTRETNDVNISNIARAEIANNANADMTIRIHCDSIDNGGKTGAVLVVPDKTGQHTKAIYPESYKFAEYLKKALQDSNVKVNGIFERSDMTGFNWSKVPVVIFEMGFMSNWNEDKMLCDKNYQTKLMEAVVVALDAYRAEKSGEQGQNGQQTGQATDQTGQNTTGQATDQTGQQNTTQQQNTTSLQQPNPEEQNALEQIPEQNELEQTPEQNEIMTIEPEPGKNLIITIEQVPVETLTPEQNELEQIPEQTPEQTLEQMPEQIPEQTSEQAPEQNRPEQSLPEQKDIPITELVPEQGQNNLFPKAEMR